LAPGGARGKQSSWTHPLLQGRDFPGPASCDDPCDATLGTHRAAVTSARIHSFFPNAKKCLDAPSQFEHSFYVRPMELIKTCFQQILPETPFFSRHAHAPFPTSLLPGSHTPNNHRDRRGGRRPPPDGPQTMGVPLLRLSPSQDLRPSWQGPAPPRALLLRKRPAIDGWAPADFSPHGHRFVPRDHLGATCAAARPCRCRCRGSSGRWSSLSPSRELGPGADKLSRAYCKIQDPIAVVADAPGLSGWW
jgi:hypothetical protein